MVVGIGRVTLLLPMAHSLKEKRMVVRRIKTKVLSRYHCAVAEVGDNDKWQSLVLGFAMVSNDKDIVEATLEKVAATIDELGEGKLVADEKEILHYGDKKMARWADLTPGDRVAAAALAPWEIDPDGFEHNTNEEHEQDAGRPKGEPDGHKD